MRRLPGIKSILPSFYRNRYRGVRGDTRFAVGDIHAFLICLPSFPTSPCYFKGQGARADMIKADRIISRAVFPEPERRMLRVPVIEITGDEQGIAFFKSRPAGEPDGNGKLGEAGKRQHE